MARYALVVGISDYDHLPDLLKPRADAEAMRSVLQAGNQFEVTLLNVGVTRDRLKEALETLLLKRGKNSDVLIYFTGHGFTAGEDEDEAQGYLATQDCRVETDGNRVLSARKGYSFQSLNGLIAKAELSSLVMLLDCCHGGSFIESAQAREKLSALNKTRYCLITACRSFEQAYAMKEAEHSIFSSAVLTALRTEEARVTALDVQRRVENELKNTGQEPLYVGAGSDVMILERWAVAAPTVSEECPYQSLNAFTPETAEFFFGREAEVNELREKLRRANFVPVLGPSGSGKSSVVRAGLVTRLQTEGWQAVAMKPDKQPMVELERVLRQFFEGAGFSTGRLREVLGGLGFGEAFPQELGALDQADIKLLLIVDQFEEVFTLCEDKAAQQAFIRRLFYLGEVGAARIKVVMTMRSDFVDNWLAAGLSRSVIGKDTVWLGALQRENLRAVIEQPAQKQGYTFEAGLLTLLLTDVDKEENCLPLLEFALTGLWDRRETQVKKLTVSAYEEMGGLTGALNRQATAVYENLRKVDRPWAKRICLSLVRVGRGDKDTRQRQPKEVLLTMGGVAQRRVIADVITDLVKGRLLVSDGVVSDGVVSDGVVSDGDVVAEAAYVDVAHEALLEGWEQFAAWRQEDRDLLRLEQRLKDAYEDWQAKEAGEERDQYLLTGGLLAEVREQRAVLSERLSDSSPALMKYFADSEQKDEANVAMLKTALAKADVQEASRKVRDKLLFTPAQTVEATISAITLVGQSQKDFADEVVYPVQDALHRAWFNIREQLKVEGHSRSVRSVTFSPAGDCIVSGSTDSTLRLWDLDGNAIGAPFEGHSGAINSVAFSPKGDCIVSGSTDSTLRLWDLDGNAIGAPFEGHSNCVYSVAFSPKGDCIVSGSKDKTLRLWDLSGKAIEAPFEGHNDWVYSVAFSPKGDCIVSGSRDNTLRLWDLDGNIIGSPFEGHNRSVRSIAFSPDGDCIVSSSTDSTIRLWDLDGNVIGSPFEGYTSLVNSVAFSPKGDCIVSGSRDNTLRLWDLDGNVIGAPIEGHSSSVNAVAFRTKGDCIDSGSGDNTLRLWNLDSNAIGAPIEGHSSSVNSVAFSPKGDCVVSDSGALTFRLWGLDGNAIGEPFEGHSGSVYSVVFSPKGDCIVSGSKDKTLRLWDLDGNAIGKPFKGHSDCVHSVVFSPKGDRIVSGSRDNTLRLWDLDGNAIGTPFEGHNRPVNSVAFNPKGDRIVSGSRDNTLRLWDLDGNAIGVPFEGHSDWVHSVAFGPSGDHIVSASNDTTLRLWDLDGNAIGTPFEGHNRSINSVVFSPSGDRIVSGSGDKTLRLWDLDGNAIGTPFEGHNRSVRSVAFSPNGDCIVSSSKDRTLRIWQIGTWEDELRYCCNLLMHHTALTLPQTETAQHACEVCQQVWTRQQSAEFLVAQGNALARRGEVDKAIAKFTRAQDLDPDLTIDPTARAQELADWSQSSTAKQ